MQIEENLALAARRDTRTLRAGITKAEREQYRELLKILDLGLEDRLTSKVGLRPAVSARRSTLLMATLKKPRLLLLDEHTAALDPENGGKGAGHHQQRSSSGISYHADDHAQHAGRDCPKEKLEQIRKKYYDARHNCYAYRVIEDGDIIDRSSDDGEPSGTAGAPMLNILKKENLCNVLVIVTRYFGGILLGTGGLVRAYSQSTQDVIEKSNIILKQEGYVAILEVEYKDLEKLRYFCKKKEIKIIDIKYLENVSVKLEFKKEEKEVFMSKENLNFDYLNYKIIQEKFI